MARQPLEHSAAEFIPPDADLTGLQRAARGCRGCPLYQHATQTVFGEGSARARIVLVGETPGDKEDKAGRPFVGPSGRLLDAALEAAGIDRKLAYVTNAVKHFKWEPRGKSRLHKTPNAREIAACRPWLNAELSLLKPQALVLLGATAAKALLGPGFRVSTLRGQVFHGTSLAPLVMATVHPSSVLRAPDDAARHAAQAQFFHDLRALARALAREHLIGKSEGLHAP